MEWHKRTGFLVIGLVTFRVIWGFVGSHHARFANFVRGPTGIMEYVRDKAAESAGHNPLGALSVVAMLVVLAFQAGSGLFANDDIMLEGPYAGIVGKEMSDWLTTLHKINSNVILVLVGLHIAAIAFYFFRKKINLILPMLTGKKLLPPGVTTNERPTWLAPAVILLAAGMVYLLVYQWPR